MHLSRNLEGMLRQYVLGELSEEARLQLEERLVADGEVFEALGVLEDELADQYLEGELSPGEKRAFESNFLTTAGRHQQLRFIQLLRDHASATATSPSREGEPGYWSRIGELVWPHPVWTASLATLVAVLVVGILWSAVTSSRLRSQLRESRAQQAVAEAQQRQLQAHVTRLTEQTVQLQGQLESARQRESKTGAESAIAAELQARAQALDRLRAQTPRQAEATPTFVLATGLLRSAGSLTRIIVPAGAQLVRLRLDLPNNDYSMFRAVLYDSQAEEIWAQSRLFVEASSGRSTVTILLPARLLYAGDYQVRLSGTAGRGELEPVGTYSFRVPAR